MVGLKSTTPTSARLMLQQLSVYLPQDDLYYNQYSYRSTAAHCIPWSWLLVSLNSFSWSVDRPGTTYMGIMATGIY